MTTLRPALALLPLAALLLAGCATPTPETLPVPDPDVIVEEPETVAAPGEEICELKHEFDIIDGLLIAANRENPPAPSYGDAALHLQSVIPPDSIKTDWVDLRDRVVAYAPIIATGDSAAIAEQADEVVAISAVHLRLFSYFQALCA